MSFKNFELIYTYSRREAIEDDVLLDMSEEARDSHWKVGSMTFSRSRKAPQQTDGRTTEFYLMPYP